MSKTTQIFYSEDGKLYYVTHALHRPQEWLSVEEMELPIDEKFKGGTFCGAVEITKRDGRTYWRKAYPFSFYEIRGGKREPLDEDSDLFKDYASASRWPEPKTTAFATQYAREIENEEKSLADAKQSVRYHEERLRKLRDASVVEDASHAS